ncbi:flagellin [Clostridium cibarium]|uniref:Flagellin n=1 Tax=Clostridium cibarium TaxID=2762247 RepID=A0ABR8PP55_9CLOT|nr:flagellin [Clostridium cibarium]MBD7909849.1 flagellin [Clostridium cibarium]
MRLNHNINSLNLYRGYKKNLKSNETAIDRISSGTKINSAKDNPNKIGQSEGFRIQIKSLEAAQRNLQDGVSMLRSADGALQEVNDTLVRIKELAVSASDGSKSPQDVKTIQDEIDQMKKAIDDLASNTEFNGVKLIGDTEVSNNSYPNYRELVTGAKVGDTMSVPLYNISTNNLRDKDGNKFSDIDVTDRANVGKAISMVDEVITTITDIRARYGALENKFEDSADRLASNTQNVEKASSNIRDTDVAVEMAELARTQILNQTQIALIAQSNKFPQDALSVLKRI